MTLGGHCRDLCCVLALLEAPFGSLVGPFCSWHFQVLLLSIKAKPGCARNSFAEVISTRCLLRNVAGRMGLNAFLHELSQLLCDAHFGCHFGSILPLVGDIFCTAERLGVHGLGS
mmetsp:Transcript_73921/g.224086  ORF Transcript_73921/g.224086 Transcript_73921/m.224086 type:complete len:115 (+) Transcript_73921:194-538(+)